MNFYRSAYPAFLIQTTITNIISKDISVDVAYKPLGYKEYSYKIFDSSELGFAVCAIIFSSFLPLLQNLIFKMQNEKVIKMRESMMMMGLQTPTFLASFIIFHLMISTFVSLEVSVMVCLGFFTHSNMILMFLIMFLFSLNLVPFAVILK